MDFHIPKIWQLGHFIKHKPHISEECLRKTVRVRLPKIELFSDFNPLWASGASFNFGTFQYQQKFSWRYLCDIHICQFFFLTLFNRNSYSFAILHSTQDSCRTQIIVKHPEEEKEVQEAHFINKRFALNEMFQRNASKFAIFYV